MTIDAKSVIQRVVDTLQDTSSIRWPVDELIRYLNDGQREIVLYRPDALVKNASLTCAAGSKQTLPTDGAKLIEVIRNTTSKTAVRLTNREILDAQIPGWHGLDGQADAKHFMYDPRDPRTFYVYPPVTAASALDIVYSAFPADVPMVGDGKSVADVTGSLAVPEIYANAIQNFVLARCYLKDSEYAGNAQRAAAHMQLFTTSLGVEFKGTVEFGPTSQSNPNVLRAAAPVQG